jgi:GGDEF domain-containing protein
MGDTLRDAVDRDRTNLDFRNFFVPRALFIALNLLFGRPLRADTVLVIELAESEGKVSSARGGQQQTVTSIEGLRSLGRTLVGWYDSDGPFQVFSEVNPDLGLPSYYVVLSVDHLLADLPGASPLRAYLVVQPEEARWLETQKQRSAQLRSSRDTSDSISDIGSGSADPFYASWKLLACLRDSADLWFQASLTTDSNSYDAPSFTLSGMGDRMLNHAANLVVELGNTVQSSSNAEWQFCCVLVPTRVDLPIQMRSLRIQGASALSPHQFGLEVPFSEHAITLRAYKNGCVISVPIIRDKSADVLYGNLEAGVKSSIAVPIDGPLTEPVAVLYVTSTAPMAFTQDDVLLLRIVGRMIGELLNSSWEQRHVSDGLSLLVQKPEVNDPFFLSAPRFGSENVFIRDLDQLTEQVRADARAGTARQPYLFAIDIDGLMTSVGIYGDKAMRSIIEKVGRRITTWMDEQSYTVWAYRIWSDRFILLLHDVGSTAAREAALALHSAINGRYEIDPEAVPVLQKGDPIAVDIRARLGLVPYDSGLLEQRVNADEIRLILEARLADTLAAGKEKHGNRIIEWDRGRLQQVHTGGMEDVRES